MEENKIIDGSSSMTIKEAKNILKKSENKIMNKDINSFVLLKDINKIYGNGVQAVFNFNLDIDKHDFIVLVGPSGCGKSTTLRMIAGLEDITSGYLYIDKVLSNYLESKNRDISMVFQSYALYPQMTVFENIAFPLRVRKYIKPVIDKKLKNNHEIIYMLNDNFEQLKNVLIESNYIGGDNNIKIHYVSKKLDVSYETAKYFLSKINIFVDSLSLNKKKIISQAKLAIKNRQSFNNKNHIEVNDKHEIIFKLNDKKGTTSKLQTYLDVKELLINRFSETINALNKVLNPENKISNKAKELEDILKIDLDTANEIYDLRVLLFKCNDEANPDLINLLEQKILGEKEKYAAKNIDTIDCIKDKNDSTKKEIIFDEILKSNYELIDALENNYLNIREHLLNKEKIEYLNSKNNALLSKFNVFSDDKIKNIILDEVNKLENEIVKEKKILKEKNLEVNDNFEILKNKEVLTKKVKLTKNEIKEKVFAAANILDLGPYLDRRPKELSGGQMQRVALGRAIVRDAKLFLMDEPLSNLDAKLRVAMRSEIVRIHEKIGATSIYVTHDQTEAMTMATKIVVMSKGWIQQVGKPQDVYNNPKNLFVATFIGSPAMNIISGSIKDNTIIFENGFKLQMSESFAKMHNDFYLSKIEECNRMLNTLDNHIEIECLEILKETKKLYEDINKNSSLIEQDLIVVRDKLMNLNKVSAPIIIESVDQALAFIKDNKESAKHKFETFRIMFEMIQNYETINKADIAKIHSAQEFSKEAPIQNVSTIHFNSKGKRFIDSLNIFKKIKTKREIKEIKKQSFSVEIGDPREYVLNLKKTYTEALNGEHKIKIGIRPENIYLANEFNKSSKSSIFTVKTDVVELLGNESYLHTSWNGIDFVSKITSGSIVEPHSDVDLVFDTNKIHIFDISSGETIL